MPHEITCASAFCTMCKTEKCKNCIFPQMLC